MADGQAMPPSPKVELLRASYAALSRGDFDAWRDTFDPNVEIHEIPTLPHARAYRGRPGLRRWLRSMEELAGEELRLEPEEFVETPRSVLVRLRVAGLLVYHVVEIEDGRIRTARAFLEQSQALEAAGLWPSSHRPAGSV
jgi:ketosteroid isomerase-like protein